MFARTFTRLTSWLRRKQVRQDFHTAWEAHREAIRRGDTRRQHETRQALTRAMTARLKVGA